jgi:hypothetical protein
MPLSKGVSYMTTSEWYKPHPSFFKFASNHVFLLKVDIAKAFGYHARDLQQGDPLSPFMFVLTMEALNSFKLADSRNMLSPSGCMPFGTWCFSM